MNQQIALVGNPNSGKTTLFNRLTGTRQTTGNWPGVTVEKKSGLIRYRHQAFELVDLPGIYSLSPYSLEEVITRNFLIDGQPSVVVNIVDVTNLERNLYLTLQLKKLGLPVIVALNMMDELQSNGDVLDLPGLSAQLGMPVVPISARRATGLQELLKEIAGGHAEIAQPQAFETETEAETAALYQLAASISDRVLQRKHKAGSLSRSDRIDRVLTNRLLAIPIFLLVMFLVFQVTFHESLGGRLTSLLDTFFNQVVGGAVSHWLDLSLAPEWIHSLLVGGIIAGVGGILTFLPQIALLFLFLSILEDTGYMARAAFIMDRVFQHLGLSGRSFIPMIMGFGCSVPAIMATRTLESKRERRLTIMIIPFMSCGARMPIYAFFAAIFFASNKGLVTFSMYLIGIVIAILSALLLNRTVLRGDEAPFVIELPPYRLPDAKSLLLHVWDKVRDFIVRAGTLIFMMTIVVWFFQTFTFSLTQAADGNESIFGVLGGLLAPLLRPLGFGTWQAAVALLTGLVAKESVVATLEILYTPQTLQAAFSPLAAYAFMVFTLLYTPCMAAVGATRREMGSWRWTAATIAFQTVTAWLLALLVFQAGSLLFQ